MEMFKYGEGICALGIELACVKEEVVSVGGGRRWIVKFLSLLLMV